MHRRKEPPPVSSWERLTTGFRTRVASRCSSITEHKSSGNGREIVGPSGEDGFSGEPARNPGLSKTATIVAVSTQMPTTAPIIVISNAPRRDLTKLRMPRSDRDSTGSGSGASGLGDDW